MTFRKFSIITAFLALLVTLVACQDTMHETVHTIFEFEVADSNGDMVSLSKYEKSPVTLIVNVASQCGFTYRNYVQLQQLYDKYHSQGLEILAFPCNQFGLQEPGSNQEIVDFVSRQFKVTFPVFGKLEVNGKGEDELYHYLKYNGNNMFNLQWNFSKFLCLNGKPIEFFPHDKEPLSFEDRIVAALAKAKETGVQAEM